MTQTSNKKQYRNGLSTILLLALALRLWAVFQNPELSSTETQNINNSLLPFYDIAFHLAHHDVQPPLYPLLLSSISIFSSHELWLRLSSIALGLYLVYWCGRLGSYWNPKTGLITAFIIAVSPPFIWASIEITHVTWLTLLGVMTLYYFWQWIQTRRFESLLIYEALILMTLYTSYAGLIWLIAFNLAFFGSYWVHNAFYQIFWKRWLINQTLLLLLYLPWAIYLPEQIQRLKASLPSTEASPSLVELTILTTFFLGLSIFHWKKIRWPKAPSIASRHLSLIIITTLMLASSTVPSKIISAILHPTNLYAVMAVLSGWVLSELWQSLKLSFQKNIKT